MSAASNAQPILIRRYTGTRLYDTANGRYVSLEQLRDWAVDRIAFFVVDSETGEDIRRALLG